MVADHEWLSPTRLIGLSAYTICFLACAARWASRRNNRVQSVPLAALAAVQFTLLLDMAFDWRWKIHDFWMREAMALGVYDRRRAPQLLALAMLSLVVALASVSIVYRFRRRLGFAVALTGTMLSVALWCCEWVSLHLIDQLFYRKVGGVMVVGLLWALLALLTSVGVWLDSRGSLSANLTR
jgi:hypothetical protein